MRRALAAACALALAPPAPGAEASTAATEVAGLLPGAYVSRDAARSVTFHVAAIPKSRLAEGAMVFYVEEAKSARPDAPFLQRFWRLVEAGGIVSLHVYEPRDLAGVRGKWREPESLALFTARDVRERPDCRMTLTKVPAGHWAGGTAGPTCFSASVEARIAIAVSLSPQTLEWREDGKAAESSVFGRERETSSAVPAPVGGGAKGDSEFSSSVKEAAVTGAPPALVVTSPSSPSKKYSLAELRGMAGAAELPLKRLFESALSDPAAVVVATSRSGAVSVFSSVEISSSSFALDVSGDSLRLVAAPGRSLEDVVSIELRVLAPAR